MHRIGEYGGGGNYNPIPGDNPLDFVKANKVPFLYIPDNTVPPLD